jgi:hypothetical protein
MQHYNKLRDFSKRYRKKTNQKFNRNANERFLKKKSTYRHRINFDERRIKDLDAFNLLNYFDRMLLIFCFVINFKLFFHISTHSS